MPESNDVDQNGAQASEVDANNLSTSPDRREPNTQPTGADIVAALANSPLTGVKFSRLSVRAKVRSEPRDMDDWV